MEVVPILVGPTRQLETPFAPWERSLGSFQKPIFEPPLAPFETVIEYFAPRCRQSEERLAARDAYRHVNAKVRLSDSRRPPKDAQRPRGKEARDNEFRRRNLPCEQLVGL